MDVAIEQTLTGTFQLDACSHGALMLWATFDHVFPARCESCGAPFTIPDALAHVAPASDARQGSAFKRARIYVNYATASRIDGGGEVCMEIPDLKVSVRHATPEGARGKCMEAVTWHLMERARHDLLPPPPRTVAALQELHPSLQQSEWHWTSIAVANYLHVVVKPAG